MTGRILIAVVLTLGAVMGVQLWNQHLIAKGDTQGAERVRTEWNTADTKRLATEATARMEAAQKRAVAEEAERTKEQAKQQEAERIAHEQAQREQAQSAALAAAESRNRSLHTTIAQLNANAAALADVPGTSAGACAAPGPDAAATARELLGACSQRYAAVAAAADQLGGQVTGLQDYVRATAQAQAAGDGDGF